MPSLGEPCSCEGNFFGLTQPPPLPHLFELGGRVRVILSVKFLHRRFALARACAKGDGGRTPSERACTLQSVRLYLLWLP